MYVGFMDLENVYDRVNRKTLWRVLRMYGARGKLLDGIKSMYVNGLAVVRVKGDESECFRIDSGLSCWVSGEWKSLECTDKGVVRSDEGCLRKD